METRLPQLVWAEDCSEAFARLKALYASRRAILPTLNGTQTEHNHRTSEIVRMETELNARVYALFDLSPAEIMIIERKGLRLGHDLSACHAHLHGYATSEPFH